MVATHKKLWLAALLVVAARGAALADPLGLYSAVVYAPLPPHATIALEPQQSSALTDQVMSRLAAQLVAKGYNIDAGGPYRLVVDVRLIRPSLPEAPNTVFSAARQTLFAPAYPIDTEFNIGFSLYDRKTGLYVWRGIATRTDYNVPADKVAEPMTDRLVSSFGRSQAETEIPGL
ncbi:MAG TPA: DUF4136 domain-containing protein [Dongiaceae bacterium]|jgi:hypothetical protein|nr:DUF4136 domain-containing protein [Dongiaceae bacterium]